MNKTSKGEAMTFQEKAIRLVFNYVKARLDKTDNRVTFSEDEVFVTWFSKTLQNWKAMLSTTLPDGMYYEVTYDGDRQRTYLDAYKKFDNQCITDKEFEVSGGYYKEDQTDELLSRADFEGGPNPAERKDW